MMITSYCIIEHFAVTFCFNSVDSILLLLIKHDMIMNLKHWNFMLLSNGDGMFLHYLTFCWFLWLGCRSHCYHPMCFQFMLFSDFEVLMANIIACRFSYTWTLNWYFICSWQLYLFAKWRKYYKDKDPRNYKHVSVHWIDTILIMEDITCNLKKKFIF